MGIDVGWDKDGRPSHGIVQEGQGDTAAKNHVKRDAKLARAFV